MNTKLQKYKPDDFLIHEIQSLKEIAQDTNNILCYQNQKLEDINSHIDTTNNNIVNASSKLDKIKSYNKYLLYGAAGIVIVPTCVLLSPKLAGMSIIAGGATALTLYYLNDNKQI